MSPEGIWKWAQIKGISVIGTGDFTHPAWIEELVRKLEPAEGGLFRLKNAFRSSDVPGPCNAGVRFILSAEISCIYRKNNRTRKIHSLVLAPGFEGALRINSALSKIGRLSSDGRPVLGLDARELLRIVLENSPGAVLVPAHAWTPHFSLLGASSGFDSIEECFDDLSPHITAIETGLSSDPAMNRRLSALDRIVLISNSDAHSPAKIGREATVFDTDLSYDAITEAVRTGRGLAGTVEFFPEEGKYHYDGHRNCGVGLAPEDSVRLDGLCPVCGKKVTVGVSHRIMELSDRGAGYIHPGAPPFYRVIPLADIIAETMQRGVNTRAVAGAYFSLIGELGNELRVLLEAPLPDIEKAGPAGLSHAVMKMRLGKLKITPGFDGRYGKVSISGNPERPFSSGEATPA